MVITFVSAQLLTRVKSVEMHHESLIEVVPRDNVGFDIENVSVKSINSGYIISNNKSKPAIGVFDLIAQAIVLNHLEQVTNSYCLVLDCHSAHATCEFSEILEKDENLFCKLTSSEAEQWIQVTVGLGNSELLSVSKERNLLLLN